MPTNKNNLTVADADAMGRELIFKIAANNFTAFKTLIKKGANINFRDENTGNTLLHFVYYYGQCAVEYLKLLLEKGAKISRNKEGQFPITLAEKNCNAAEFQKIKEIFDRDTTTPFNFTNQNPKKPAALPYDQQKWAITIGMPILAVINGILAGGFQELAQRYKERPYFRNVIFYVQPIIFALPGAAMNSWVFGNAADVGIEDACLSVMFYVGINYLGLMFAQLGENFTKKFQSKVLNLLIPILLYTFYFNPSLIIKLLSEGFKGVGFQAELMPLLATLSSGGLFKFGKFGSKKLINKFFRNNTTSSCNNAQAYFLKSVETPEVAHVDEPELAEIKLKLNALMNSLKNNIKKQDYLSNFNDNIESANNKIESLITHAKNGINQKDEYLKIFNDFESSLTDIQKKLNTRLEQSQNRKLEDLRNNCNELLVSLRAIRPMPMRKVKSSNSILNHREEEPMLLRSFTNNDDENKNHYQTPKNSPVTLFNTTDEQESRGKVGFVRAAYS